MDLAVVRQLPGATNFTSPLSLVTDCSVAATAACNPSARADDSGDQGHGVLLAGAGDAEP
jgi:hypothetical protein